jgi:VanZ family protein
MASAQRKTLLRVIWSVAILTIILGSLLPARSLPMRMLDQLDLNDKLEHFVAYAVLAFLPAIHERLQGVLVTAVCIAALGIGLEFGQLYSPGRSFEIADIIAEGLGICFGLAVGLPLRRSNVVRSLLCTPGK